MANPSTICAIVFEVLLLSVAIFLWLIDGAPGWNIVCRQLPIRWLSLQAPFRLSSD